MARDVPASGTVYTPPELARAMVEAIHVPGARWLDPCAGRGAFPLALAELGVPSDHVTCLDLDPIPPEVPGRHRSGVDFIRWSSTEGAATSFDRVALNPPYVPICELAGEPGQWARATPGVSGRPWHGRTSYWAVFLFRAIQHVASGGSLVAVLPASYETAEYAVNMRAALAASFGRVHVFRSRQPLFDDVGDGCVVVVAEGRGGPPTRYARVEVADRRDMLFALSHLRRARAVGVEVSPVPSTLAPHVATLGDRCSVDRGPIAMHRDFVLSRSELARRNVPIDACVPVVSSAKHLSPILDGDAFLRLVNQDRRVWLFQPSKDDVRRGVREHLAYLDRETRRGSRRARQDKQRPETWWITDPQRPDAAYVSRFGACPALAVPVQHIGCTTTLVRVRLREDGGPRALAGLAIGVASSASQRWLAGRGRAYAKGVIEIQLRDFQALPFPAYPNRSDAVEAWRTIGALPPEDRQREADRWLALPSEP